ncbi:MAG TPA: RHS repeat-associated core domain-containing protein, partial [Amycolatopsis sp.]|nr:RHS repeat-associated core domain-containing protein [Amycolatopsis sp.]
CVRTVGDRGFLDGAFEYAEGVTRHTDSLGHTTTFELNALNQVVRETDPLGNATTFLYDRYDHLLSRTDPLGRTTSYRYDGVGRLSAVTRPDRSTVDVNADPEVPLSISVTDGERRWSREYADGAPEGQLGAAEDFRYESLQEDDEPIGRNEHRDLFGRPRVRTDVFGGQVRFEWTVEGLRAARVGRAGEREQWRYDAEGNEIEHVTASGAVERAEFGPFGLRTASIDATGARTTYGYDTELRLTSVTNPGGQTWHYRYDPAGRLVEERNFDGRVLRFSYDAAGRLVRSVNGVGEAIDYRHDALGNVVERHTPAGITGYAYDPVGNVLRVSTSDSVLEYERDADGLALRETVGGRSVLSTYDERGRLIRRRTPSGVDSVWHYDAAGNARLLSFAGHALEFEYDAAGREVRRTIDGSVALTQTYDAADRLTGQAVATPSGTLQQRRFDYRGDGALAALTDSLTGTTRYSRDPAGRIVEVAASDHVEHYRYDVTGRLSESTVDGSWPVAAESGTRQYTANTLSGAGIVGYTHDAQGRLVARHVVDPVNGAQTWRFDWDPLDRLAGVTTPDGTHWLYRYDPVGRRSAKIRLNPDGTTAERVDFAWAGTILVEQVHTDAAGRREVLTWAHHPDGDRPVAQAGPAFHAVVTDQLGTPTELIDPAAAQVRPVRSALWGRALPGAAIPLRFPGQYADAETGLHYNVYRYYDPATGRYLSQDPLGLAPAPDPAAYVPDPLRQADPLGLMLQSPCGKGGGGYKAPQQTPGGGFDPGRSQPVKPKLSDVNPSSGRTVQQGGGWYGGGHYGPGSSTSNAAGNSPKPGHLTDVEDLNQASVIKDKIDPQTGEHYSENDLSQDLVDHLEANGLPADTKWIKGHLENDNIGGPGEAHNLTPLTSKANSAHKNGVESSIKELVDRVNGEAFRNNGITGVGVDYHVHTSPNTKFPNSPNAFEHSIRDYIEINAKYTGVDQNVLDTMRRNGMRPFAELPPPGTRMDTITGEFHAPDGNGGYVPWRKGNKGHDFSDIDSAMDID